MKLKAESNTVFKADAVQCILLYLLRAAQRSVVYIMKKLILHTALAFFAVLCTSAISEATQDQQVIDFESIQYIDMAQNGKEGIEFRLSNDQAKELTNRWNQARAIGLCEFYAKYIIIIHGKNGDTRTFRAMEDTMKEGNDYCFVLEDHYLEKVWKSQQ